MTTYGIPYFLEDRSGSLNGSEFVDLHDRMRLTLRCTAKDASRQAYMIYKTSSNSYQPSFPHPSVALDFESGGGLGSVTLAGQSPIPMKKFLARVSVSCKTRRFLATDGQEYTWTWRVQEGQEWTCTNPRGYLIAYYSLKTPGEPHYEGSSGCVLTVDESFGHLAPELLGTLIIMRHIQEHNL